MEAAASGRRIAAHRLLAKRDLGKALLSIVQGRDELSPGHYSLGIERFLDRAHRREPRRSARPRPPLTAPLADAILRRGRNPRRGGEVVAESGGRPAHLLAPPCPGPTPARGVEKQGVLRQTARRGKGA